MDGVFYVYASSKINYYRDTKGDTKRILPKKVLQSVCLLIILLAFTVWKWVGCEVDRSPAPGLFRAHINKELE